MTALQKEAPSAQLIEKAASGDPTALDLLVQRYYRTVFSIGYARLRDWELAEELAQEVFLRATLHLSSLRDRSLFGPWLVRIARNTAEDWARQGVSRARTVTWIPLESLSAEPPDTNRPSARDLHERRDEERLLAEALSRLSPELREVVLLHFSEGLTKSAIARRLDLHPSASSIAPFSSFARIWVRGWSGPYARLSPRPVARPAPVPPCLPCSLCRKPPVRRLPPPPHRPSVWPPSPAAARPTLRPPRLLRPPRASWQSCWPFWGAGEVPPSRGPLWPPPPQPPWPVEASWLSGPSVPPSLPARHAPMVYLAATTPTRPEDQTTADAFHSLLRFHLQGAPTDSLPLNTVARFMMESIYRRADGSTSLAGRSRDEYLRDARSLGADFYLGTRVESGDETISLELDFVDLHTSRTASSTTATTHRQFPRLLEETIRVSARFCGLSDWEIAAAALTDGLPSPATWEFLRTKDENPGEVVWKQAIATDPKCRSLYMLAAETLQSLPLINQGLTRWPDDPRLLFSKASVLRQLGRYEPAALFCSDLNRRYPESLIFTNWLIENLISLYPARPEPSSPPEAFLAGAAAMENVARRYPSGLVAWWQSAYANDCLGMLVRGCRFCATIETTLTEEQARMEQELGRRAREEIDTARTIRPDVPGVLRDTIAFHSRSGHTDIQWQRAMLEELARLDPTDAEGAIAAAQSHVMQDSNDRYFIELLTEAAARHRNQPKVLARIADVIGTELSERMRRGTMTPEAVYRNRNPFSDLYLDCIERALDGGIQVEKWMAGMLREIYLQRYGEGKVNELIESGKHWALTGGGAKTAHEQQDYERCLRLARMALPKAPTPDAREQMLYYIVKSLWKLNRLDEALAETRKGISEFPDQQTFHYMFAVVALERGDPLEEAYERAKRTVDILTTNTGANEVYETLRRRLRK